MQVVLVGPPGHGKAALYGLLLVNLGMVARHTIERIVQTYGPRYDGDMLKMLAVFAAQSDDGGHTLRTVCKKVDIARTAFTLVNTPSQPFLYRERIKAVANADVAVLVVSAESQEFAVCMAGCSSASLFETALLIKAVGIEHVIVAMTKADAVRTEAETEEAVQELIVGRTRKVEEMLLSLHFKRENIQTTITSARENKGLTDGFLPDCLCVADALCNIQMEKLPLQKSARLQQKMEEQSKQRAPFRHSVIEIHWGNSLGPVGLCGRVVSGKFNHDDQLVYYPAMRYRPSEARVRGSAEHCCLVPTAEVGVWLRVSSHNIRQSYIWEGSVGMTAEEDGQTMLQLTVLEFTARLHAVSPVSAKGEKVLSVGQTLMLHSHGAHAVCKIMAIEGIKRGGKALEGPFVAVDKGDVTEVCIRPLKPFVMEPFEKFPPLGRVLLYEAGLRAFGHVKQVVKLFKPSFADPTFFGSEAIWQQIGKEPQLLLGRNEDNNSLIHLFITHFHQEEERLLENITNALRMVNQSFGRAAVFRLMRVRNNQGHMALHLALRAGLFKVAAALLSWGSPLMPSLAEQEQLRRLWKKPVDTPIRCFIGGKREKSPLSLALLCLLVLSCDREEFTNLDEMLPPREMQQLFLIALQSFARAQPSVAALSAQLATATRL